MHQPSAKFLVILHILDVEYTMPLRPESKKRINISDEERIKNSSFDSCYDTMDDKYSSEVNDKKEEEDDEDPDKFLSAMGFESEVIKKINITQVSVLKKIFFVLL